MIAGFAPPVPLSARHDLSGFDCGEASLNQWLQKRARANETSQASRTYVVCRDEAVAGYYCLSAGAVAHVTVSRTLRRNMPDPIPVVVLGRLAVDHRHQGQGIGRGMLRDAIRRAAQAGEIVGAAALLVHALSGDARRFYLSSGFMDSPIQPLTLCLPLATLRKL